MIDTSDTLQSPFQPDTPVGIVLYLGAGRAVDLPEWQATDAKQIVLVEPNPAAFSGLQNHANQDARITVLQLAVSNKTGQAPLHVMTVPDFSSLCRASGISVLFPGLRQVSTPEVETVSVADLISQITIPAALPNVLILDVPGMEADVLDQMDEGDYLGLFEHVVLRGAAAQAYEGARAVAPLIAQLTAKGYNLEFSDESDPDFLSCRLRRDPITLQLAAAKRAAEITAATHENALADLLAQRDAEKANAENIAQAAEAANTAHENALADLQAQLQAQQDAEKVNAKNIARATEAANTAHENALADLQRQLQAQRDAEKANAESIAQATEATSIAHENALADLQLQLQAQQDAEKANAESIAQATEATSIAHENALADLPPQLHA
jgi:FkbM family methyltransferase